MSLSSFKTNHKHSKGMYRKVTLAFLFCLGLTMALIETVNLSIADANNSGVTCSINKNDCSEVLMASKSKQ